MQALGANMAKLVPPGAIIYLQGELGAGKTTLVRGFLRGLHFTGKVKSPTYTLIEPYHLNDLNVYHLDLYRLKDPHELVYLGLSDYLTENAICLIEWPERALKLLPQATLYCTIKVPDDGQGRVVELTGSESLGEKILSQKTD